MISMDLLLVCGRFKRILKEYWCSNHVRLMFACLKHARERGLRARLLYPNISILPDIKKRTPWHMLLSYQGHSKENHLLYFPSGLDDFSEQWETDYICIHGLRLIFYNNKRYIHQYDHIADRFFSLIQNASCSKRLALNLMNMLIELSLYRPNNNTSIRCYIANRDLTFSKWFSAILACGVDIEAQFINQHTVLTAMCSLGYNTCVSMLLDAGASVKQTEHGHDPLTCASQAGSISCIDLLLSFGADLNNKSYTELIAASRRIYYVY